MSAIPEAIFFCQERPGFQQRETFVKAKGRKPVPVKWVFKSMEEAEGFIFLKSRNVVKVYMQVPLVEFKKSFYPVASDTSTRILIGLNLYYEYGV